VGDSVASTINTDAVTPVVGTVVGSAAISMTPNGWLLGASGQMTIAGIGLDQVVSVSVLPATGITLGAPVASNNGTRLDIPVSVAIDAARTARLMRLVMASGNVVWVDPSRALLNLGSLPTMASVSPIVLQRGGVVTLTIRGSDLQWVTGASFAPGDGISVVSVPLWSQDAFGELLTFSVSIDANAATGNRVLQLQVPGGATTATPSSANTVQVVTQQ
jgi:hypothetical protein